METQVIEQKENKETAENTENTESTRSPPKKRRRIMISPEALTAEVTGFLIERYEEQKNDKTTTTFL